jgi:hypothetical protein
MAAWALFPSTSTFGHPWAPSEALDASTWQRPLRLDRGAGEAPEGRAKDPRAGSLIDDRPGSALSLQSLDVFALRDTDVEAR